MRTRPAGHDEVARAFELRGRTRRCAELVDVSDKDVLNIGSSIGWFERYCIEAGARTVTGIDTSEEALDVAKQAAPSATFVWGSALSLPLEDEQFDVVALLDVLEHLPAGSEARALAEIRRVLRPDGVLALSTPNRHWLPTLADPAYYFGHRHYREAQVERLLRDAGLVPVTSFRSGAAFDLLDLLLYYLWRHALRRERHPFGLIRQLADGEWERDDGRNSILVIARAAPGGAGR